MPSASWCSRGCWGLTGNVFTCGQVESFVPGTRICTETKRRASGWYRSDVPHRSVQGATDSTCTPVKTFRSSSDSLDCSATDGSSTVQFHLQFKIDKDAPPSPARRPTAPRTGTAGTTTRSRCSSRAATRPPVSPPARPPRTAAPTALGERLRAPAATSRGTSARPGSFALKYDATAPSATASPARAPDANGWYNHAVGVGFSGTDAGSGVDSCAPRPPTAGPTRRARPSPAPASTTPATAPARR